MTRFTEGLSRYQRLGLRGNPFRTLTDDEWAELAVLSAPVIAAAQGGDHLIFTGRKGRGKSSALRGLARHFEAQGLHTHYERLAPGQHHMAGWPAAPLQVLLLDEAQRLNLRDRLRLMRAAAGGLRLVIGTHGGGYRPLMRLHGLGWQHFGLNHASLATFSSVIEARLAYFALPGAPERASLSGEALRLLYHRFGSNLRGAEHLLYDLFEALEVPGPVTKAQLAAYLAGRHAQRG